MIFPYKTAFFYEPVLGLHHFREDVQLQLARRPGRPGPRSTQRQGLEVGHLGRSAVGDGVGVETYENQEI